MDRGLNNLSIYCRTSLTLSPLGPCGPSILSLFPALNPPTCHSSCSSRSAPRACNMNSGSCKKLKRSKPPLVAKVSLCGDPHAGHPVTSFGGPQSLHQYRRQDATARPMESLDLVLDDRGAVLVRGCIQRRLEIHLLHIEKPADRNPAWPSASHGIHGSLMSLIDSQIPHIPQRARPNLFRNACSSCRPNCRDSWLHSPKETALR